MNKYLNTLIQIIELPVQNKTNTNFAGDCIIAKPTDSLYITLDSQFRRPCENILCSKCIFSKAREAHKQGLTVLSKYRE